MIPTVGPKAQVSGDPAPMSRCLKGIACNGNVDLPLLRLDWLHVSVGPWLPQVTGVPLVPHLYGDVPTDPQLAMILAHPNFDNCYLTLNEVDWPDFTAADAARYARTVMAQMDAVLRHSETCNFVVWAGSPTHEPWSAKAWFPVFWNYIDKTYRARVIGLHTHWYPGWGPLSLVDYAAQWANWRDVTHPRMQLWLTETGRYYGVPPQTYVDAVTAQVGLNGKFDRWAWFAEVMFDHYMGLMDADTRQVTDTGSVFALL